MAPPGNRQNYSNQKPEHVLKRVNGMKFRLLFVQYSLLFVVRTYFKCYWKWGKGKEFRLGTVAQYNQQFQAQSMAKSV
jgi:hypothetical protein